MLSLPKTCCGGGMKICVNAVHRVAMFDDGVTVSAEPMPKYDDDRTTMRTHLKSRLLYLRVFRSCLLKLRSAPRTPRGRKNRTGPCLPSITSTNSPASAFRR